MIRPLTLISASLFVLSGAYLFAVKQRSQVLDDKMAQVAQATRLDEQRVRVLQAQWALEADPSRLQQLAANFTTLQPMKPDQLEALSQLAAALPAPNSPVPGGSQPAPSVPVADADGTDTGQVAQATPAASSQAGAGVHLASAEQAAPAESDGDGAARQEASSEAVAPLGAQVHLVSAELVGPSDDAVRPARHVPVYEAAHRLPATAPVLHKRLTRVALRREVPVRHSESHLYMARAMAVSPEPAAQMSAPLLRVRDLASETPPLPPPMSDNGGSVLGMAQSGSDN